MKIKPLLTLIATAMIAFTLQPANAESDAYTQYVIQNGDSLWKLCKKFEQEPEGCWSTLADINKISDPNVLRPGVAVQIPYSWSLVNAAKATVQYVIGDIALYSFDAASNTQSEQSTVLEKGAELKQGDRIVTASASHTLIKFADETKMRVRPNSDLILDLLRQNKAQTHIESTVLLKRGKVSSLVNPNKKKSQFEVKTPFAVAAVRGTEFRVSANEKTSSSEVLEGLVAVSAAKQQVALKEGFGSVVQQGAAPSPAIKLLPGPTVSPIKDLNGPKSAKIRWRALNGAQHYEVDVLALSGVTYEVLSSAVTENNIYTTEQLPVGSYKVVVRAVDENKLTGLNSTAVFKVEAKKKVTCKPALPKRSGRPCKPQTY